MIWKAKAKNGKINYYREDVVPTTTSGGNEHTIFTSGDKQKIHRSFE